MPIVQMVCLANSRKIGGRCVAGWKMDGTGWLRPVSGQKSGTLLSEYLYQDGTEAKLLDLVELDVTVARPESYQPENWVLGLRQWVRIQKIGQVAAAQILAPALVIGPVLLGNTSDRVLNASLSSQPALASLALIEPAMLTWSIQSNWEGTRRSVRCHFALSGTNYSLGVTDPLFSSRALRSLADGQHPREVCGIGTTDRVFLTISLGAPYINTGACHKLVAAVVVV